MTKLSVEAELRIKAQQGQRALQQLAGRLQGLQSALGSTQTAAGSLARSFAGLAAGYVGINALVGGMRALTTSAIDYQRGLEGTSIGLASVMSAVEGISFEEARAQSQQLFRQIQDDAIRSVATSQELFSVFQGIYGPLRNAGVASGEIRQTMLDTVSAATALNIDLPQASRDVQAMARGAAGVDVRLFSMLRSTGAIAEDAEAFNRLSAPERIERMRAALGRFSAASDAYATSFAGVTSTFTDVVQNLTSAFFGPTFREFSSFLGRVNEQLISNREGLRSSIGEAGERVAAVLGGLFRRIEAGLTYVIQNFDPLMARATEFVNKLREVVPELLKAASAFMAIQFGVASFGRLLGILSSVVGAAGGLAELGLLGGGGAAAAGAGTAGAAGGAAGAGGLASAMAALGAAAGPLAIIVAVLAAALIQIGSVALVVYERIDAFQGMLSDLSPMFEAMAADFSAIFADFFQIIRPFLQVIGTVILTVVVPALLMFLSALRLILAATRFAMDGLRTLADLIRTNITEPFRDSIIQVGRLITSILGGALGAVRSAQAGQAERARAGARGSEFAGMEEAATRQQAAYQSMRTFGARAPTMTRERRPVQHNDFRGSRISVNQEFRQADPDRVALQMIEDINRQAEARIQSGFVPALTR